MKILFITSAKGMDYLSDCIFHGLVQLGNQVVDSKYLWYLSQPLSKQQKLHLYGKGFTISGNLPDRSNIDRTNLQKRIIDKEFDCIIYGSIHRCNDFLNIVTDIYKSNKIIFLDGEDIWYNDHLQIDQGIDYNLTKKGIYFKRELNHSKVLPISFSIPKQKIITEKVEKALEVATIFPGKFETYIYNEQKDYYMGYAKSKFGITFKKSGWDCMRHYEIIANNCLPYFMDIKHCPQYTMTNYPKDLQLEANNIYENNKYDRYENILNEFFNYCKNNLTTEAAAKYILSKLF